MENNLNDSILRVCAVLNKHSVQYMIVGGTAVALHGYFRPSINLAGSPAEKLILTFGTIQLMKIICNYSVPNLAISARAFKTFCPDFIAVSMTDLKTAKPSAPSSDLN